MLFTFWLRLNIFNFFLCFEYSSAIPEMLCCTRTRLLHNNERVNTAWNGRLLTAQSSSSGKMAITLPPEEVRIRGGNREDRAYTRLGLFSGALYHRHAGRLLRPSRVDAVADCENHRHGAQRFLGGQHGALRNAGNAKGQCFNTNQQAEASSYHLIR